MKLLVSKKNKASLIIRFFLALSVRITERRFLNIQNLVSPT